MLIVEFDGPPSCLMLRPPSLDASETGESTKCPWVVAAGLKETKMAARRTQRSTPTISRKNRGL